MSLSIKALSSVAVSTRCPSCAHRVLRRGANPSGDDMEGHALWELMEGCIICDWNSVIQNVKVGV